MSPASPSTPICFPSCATGSSTSSNSSPASPLPPEILSIIAQYLHSGLRLVGLDPLPVVRRITKLYITNPYGFRQVEPSSAVAIAAHLPSLEQFDLELCAENKWRFPVMRRQHRLDTVHALTSFTLSATAMHSFRHSYGMTIPLDHNYPIPSALHSSSPPDHLSVALFHLSQLPTLKQFTLDLDSRRDLPSMLWPDDPPTVSSSAIMWPALEYMEICAHPTTPTGDWYLERDLQAVSSPRSTPPAPSPPPSPSNSSRPHTPNSTTSSQPDTAFRHAEDDLSGQLHQDVFRTKVCPTTFNPLALSFARAVTHMPNLQSFYFRMENINPTKHVAEWAQAGAPADLDDLLEEDPEVENPRDVNRWIIAMDPGAQWQVPDEVMEVLREGIRVKGLVIVKELEE